jgi:hypothetical protein
MSNSPCINPTLVEFITETYKENLYCYGDQRQLKYGIIIKYF